MKRFLDTGFLDQKWIRKLQPDRKIFLVYLMLKCDNGGIIDLDFEDASFWIGKKIESIDFLPENYLIPLNNSGKYFMPKFIDWQYKELSSNKYIVVQARQILEKHGLINSDFTLNLSNNHIKVSKDLPESQVTGIGIGIGNGIGIGKKEEKAEFDFSFVEQEWKLLFEEWLTYKKSRKEYYKTQQSIEACYRNLKTLSRNDITVCRRVLDKSMGNNYQGLVPVEESRPVISASDPKMSHKYITP